MDVSEEYIKMCGKAVELQEMKNGIYRSVPDHEKSIWVPRLDELLEILSPGDNSYMKFKEVGQYNECYSAWSVEEAVIQMCMKKHCDKLWHEEEWVLFADVPEEEL